MASKEVWEKVKEYFIPDEFDDPFYPGSGKKIDEELLLKLFELRKRVGRAVIIHSAVGGAVDVYGRHGHAPNSYHLLRNGAKAVDFHFNPCSDDEVRWLVKEVLLTGFNGVGIYYDWSWGGRRLPVGFHVDVRPKERYQLWKRENGKYFYLLK